MKEWNVKVTKLTDIDLLHKVASFTTGHESKMSLLTAYKNRHSIIRSQLFLVEMTDIPLFCASQFVRSTQGVNWYQRTKRIDRGGEDFNDVCRNIAFEIRTEHVNHMDTPAGQLADNYGEYADKVEQLPERFDRFAPTDLCGIMNAEAIMNMSAKRLCAKASAETRHIWEQVLMEVKKVDPDLVKFCVKPCIARGLICREYKGCGFNKTGLANSIVTEYRKLFI